MFKWFKKLIASQEVRDQENYARLVESIHDAARVAGYDYPTVRVLCSWLLAHVHSGPTEEDLKNALAHVSGDEDLELSRRLDKTLQDASQRVRH